MELSPWLQKVVTVLAGVAVGVAAEIWLKDTGLYAAALVAAGTLLGIPIPSPTKMFSSPPPPPAGK